MKHHDVALYPWSNLSSVVDARLLVASSVQANAVEHAHEDDPVWKIIRRRTPPRFSDELLNPSKCATTNCDGIFDSAKRVTLPLFTWP